MVDASLPVSSLLAYVAALSVATERVTEFLKRIPGISTVLSTPQPDKREKEDLRVMSVHLLAALVAMMICYFFPGPLQQDQGTQDGLKRLGECFGYGVLASGGSSFWNGALDTLRSAKKTMGGNAV